MNRFKGIAKKGLLVVAAAMCVGPLAACSQDQDFYQPEAITATDGSATGQPGFTDDPGLMDIIANSKGEGKYVADASWEEQLASGKLDININAAISVPDVDKYPVAKVSDLLFTQENADKAFAYLSQGKELLGDGGVDATEPADDQEGEPTDDAAEPTEAQTPIEDEANEEIPMTAESLQAEIDKMTNVKAELEKGNTEIDGVSYSQTPEEIQSLIDALEDSKAQISQATTGSPAGQSDGAVTKFDEVDATGTTGKQLYAYVDLGRPARDRILIQNYEERFFQHSRILFDSADLSQPSILDDGLYRPGAEAPAGVSMTKADAEAKAKEAAEALGLQLDIASVRVGYGYMWEQTQKEGWVVRMRRNVAGVPMVATREGAVKIKVNSTNAGAYGLDALFEGSADAPDIAPMESVAVDGFDYEELMICLDDSGIIYLDWKGNAKLGDMENDNVKLLPFADIKQKVKDAAKDMTLNGQDMQNDDTIDKVAVNIDQMQLGLMRMPIEGDSQGGRLLPVWTISGSYTPEYNKDKTLEMLGGLLAEGDESPEDAWNEHYSPESQATQRQGYGVQLVINALDGSVIAPEV